MFTPTHKKMLLSLTREELVEWILHRFPWGYTEEIYQYALKRRFNMAIKRENELLDKIRKTENMERKKVLTKELDALQNKIDRILEAMDPPTPIHKE